LKNICINSYEMLYLSPWQVVETAARRLFSKSAITVAGNPSLKALWLASTLKNLL
jgi:hypothetical protein